MIKNMHLSLPLKNVLKKNAHMNQVNKMNAGTIHRMSPVRVGNGLILERFATRAHTCETG